MQDATILVSRSREAYSKGRAALGLTRSRMWPWTGTMPPSQIGGSANRLFRRFGGRYLGANCPADWRRTLDGYWI